jgi:iron(III) transport system ATP-binding protein
MVFQSLALWPHMTARQHLVFALGRKVKDRAAREERIQGLFTAVRLTGLENRRPAALSGGERQRLAIARALASGSRLLLLDEPFSSLDEPLRIGLSGLVRGLRESGGVTILHVTHTVEDALATGGGIAVMRQGRIVAEWDAEAARVLTKQEILSAFGRDAR